MYDIVLFDFRDQTSQDLCRDEKSYKHENTAEMHRHIGVLGKIGFHVVGFADGQLLMERYTEVPRGVSV